MADPRVRLIAFHHAGGSAVSYHRLAGHLPADWELFALDLPGRGKRQRHPALTAMADIVRTAASDVAPHTDVPYALFGHSMGAVVAAEVARQLTAVSRPPVWVGVSGRPAPTSIAPPGTALSALPDPQLFTALRRLGGIPDALAEIAEFREHFLTVVRPDLIALDGHVHDPERTRLSAPVSAFGGCQDESAHIDELSGWAVETTGRFRLHTYPGGHFYLHDQEFTDVAPDLVADLRRALTDADLLDTATLGAGVRAQSPGAP